MIGQQAHRRPAFLVFHGVTCPTAEADIAMIEKLAERYDEDSGDTVSEYVETLGVTKDQQRLVKAAIRRLQK